MAALADEFVQVCGERFWDADGRGAERQDGVPVTEPDGADGEAGDLPGPLPE